MLKSIIFLLVLISFITTPTRAYEAYNNIGALLALEASEKQIKNQSIDIKSTLTTSISSDSSLSDSMVETHNLCSIAIKDVQESHNIKENLLQTIASVESGKYISSIKARLPWPWTVHANGKGKYYKTKQEAITAVKQLQASGYTNIDVGCMQINLKYHGSSFKNLEEAFDPKKNVTYSATFLQKLYKKTNDWKKTAMQYHSKNTRRGINYKNRLERHYAEYIRTDIKSVLF